MILSGPPGVGASSLARAFCAGGRAAHRWVGTTEAAVMAPALRPPSAEDPASLRDPGRRAAAARARGFSAGGPAGAPIVPGDAVDAVAGARAAWGPAALVVEVACPGSAAHRARVERRRAEAPPGIHGPDRPAVPARRWTPWGRPVLRLDSAEASPDALTGRPWDALA